MTDLTMNNFDNHSLVYAPHTALKNPVVPFECDDADYRTALQEHMWKTMVAHRGIGLAANQINLNASVFIMKEHHTKQPLFCANPAVHEVSDNKVLMLEGCLSDPGMYLKVKRPNEIQVSWENISGEREIHELQGLNARAFLHEFDHLCGVLFTDRVGRVKLEAARKKKIKLLNG
jgi:peptide deformylase